jgi:arsenite-transporting ATPase
VLIVSTDPASSLSATLGAAVTAEPRPVPGVNRLQAADVDAARAFRRWLSPRTATFAQIAVRGTYLDDEDVSRLLKLAMPGVDEVIGLLEVARLARGFDVVVVDTAPTGHTLRLLAAPALLGRVAALVDALQSHHRAVVTALRGFYRTDAGDALIEELRSDGERLSSLLRSAGTEVSWVTLPEPMALEETADARAALGAAGIAVRRLIVNRLTPPPPGSCEWCDARRRFESRALAPLARRFGDLEIASYPEVEGEPRGVPALRSLSGQLTPWRRQRVGPRVAHRVRGRPHAGRAAARPRCLWLDQGVVPVSRPGWLLFGGKGGVGKSTCAAAAALGYAETRRVLLLSTDPAHSLGDVFGQRFDNTPRPVNGAARLHVREIDAASEMDLVRRNYLDAVDEAFARMTRGGAGDRAAFRKLLDLAPPGIDEVIAVADVADAVTGVTSGYDLVVTDTAPTGHALRLLRTPAVLREWTQALMTLLLKYREVVGAGSLAALLVRLSTRLRRLQAALSDPTRTRFIVVTRPATLPSEESSALITALDGLDIQVGGVIVNAVGRGTCRRCRAIGRAQAREVERFRKTYRSYAIIEAAAEVPPPHGIAALTAWRSSWRQVTS